MGSRFRRIRRAAKPQVKPERVTGIRRHYALSAGVISVLVLAVLLVGWWRRSGNLIRDRSDLSINDGVAQPLSALAKPTLSPSSTVEEIMAELEGIADQIAQSFPEDADALDVLARVEFALGNRTEAIELWRKCAQLNPADASAYVAAMGIVAANGGEPDKAVELCRKAMELGSQDPQIPLLLADNLMKTGKLDEAVAQLESYLQGNSVSVPALTNLGQAYLELDQYEKAKAAFHSAIEIAPNNKSAVYGLATTYARLRDMATAATYMEKFTNLDKEQSSQQKAGLRTFSDDSSTRQVALRALIDSAHCYRSHQQLDKAENLLRNAASLVPDNVESRLALMSLYEETGRDQHALEICRQLIRIDPNHGDYWMNVGVLSARLGNLDEGLSALKRALQLDPHNSRYREVHDFIQRESDR